MVLTRLQTIELVEAVREWDSHTMGCVACANYDRFGDGWEPCEEGKLLYQYIRVALLIGAQSGAA